MPMFCVLSRSSGPGSGSLYRPPKTDLGDIRRRKTRSYSLCRPPEPDLGGIRKRAIVRIVSGPIQVYTKQHYGLEHPQTTVIHEPRSRLCSHAGFSTSGNCPFRYTPRSNRRLRQPSLHERGHLHRDTLRCTAHWKSSIQAHLPPLILSAGIRQSPGCWSCVCPVETKL